MLLFDLYSFQKVIISISIHYLKTNQKVEKKIKLSRGQAFVSFLGASKKSYRLQSVVNPNLIFSVLTGNERAAQRLLNSAAGQGSSHGPPARTYSLHTTRRASRAAQQC